MTAEGLARFGADLALVSRHLDEGETALEVTEEEWDQVLDTNLKGIFFTAQAVARRMVPRRAGKIINVSSIFGSVGLAWLAR